MQFTLILSCVIKGNPSVCKCCCDQIIYRLHAVQGHGHTLARTHRPRDASSKGRIVQGTHRPRDASSKGLIVQGTHRPRDGSSKNFGSGTHRSVTHCHSTDYSIILYMLLRVYFALHSLRFYRELHSGIY
jgi:hypothetical protein